MGFVHKNSEGRLLAGALLILKDILIIIQRKVFSVLKAIKLTSGLFYDMIKKEGVIEFIKEKN